ncbi:MULTISPECIES: transcriptional regulator [Lentzea]|uniref:Helix-turn-helix n=2 Tax=Lentzea TaxID=165301 RepID=A0A1W2DC53_9PSEU|nr:MULTISPECIES: transcriptional regulator [Lentzea]MDX8140520.1 helix-turn-helix domain-containing protein [Lentzea sp. BCCO 10_0061]SMC95097.1 Helix-turn-helix [Lentzea albidocapillata]
MPTPRSGLAELRRALGLTQEKLAEAVGVSVGTIGRWERGETKSLSPVLQPLLAKALGLTGTRELIIILRPRAQEQSAGAPNSGQWGISEPADLAQLDPVQRIQLAAQAFQKTDRRVGGGVLYLGVVQYLNQEVAPQLLNVGNASADAVRLFSAAASMTELAGWMAHDGSGDDARARSYFDRAFRLASAGENDLLSANVCASMSHLAIELGQPDDAIRIATKGLARAGDHEGALRLVARLHAMRARAFGLAGERRPCTEELNAAEAMLDISAGEQSADWITGFDEASLAGEAALCFLDLAEYEEAEHQAREVIRLRSGDRVRSRVFGQLTLAKVLVGAGRVDEAAVVGTEVCGTASSLSSGRVVRRLDLLARNLEGARRVPEVEVFLAAQGAGTRGTGAQEGRTATWPI